MSSIKNEILTMNGIDFQLTKLRHACEQMALLIADLVTTEPNQHYNDQYEKIGCIMGAVLFEIDVVSTVIPIDKSALVLYIDRYSKAVEAFKSTLPDYEPGQDDCFTKGDA